MSTPKNRDGDMQNCCWQLLESPVKKTRMPPKVLSTFYLSRPRESEAGGIAGSGNLFSAQINRRPVGLRHETNGSVDAQRGCPARPQRVTKDDPSELARICCSQDGLDESPTARGLLIRPTPVALKRDLFPSDHRLILIDPSEIAQYLFRDGG
jgi:hypothetical protein